MLERTLPESSIGITKEVLDAVHAEQAAARQQWREDSIVEGGTYATIPHSYKKRDPAPADHVLNGHDVYSLRVTLTVGDKTITQFHDCMADAVHKQKGSLRNETVVGALLADATGTIGQPFEQTLEAAVGKTFLFKMSKSRTRNGAQPRNWVNGITVP